MPYTYMFPRPSVTATVLFINPTTREFLVGIRTRDNEVFAGMPCLVGGFMNPRIQHKDFQDNYGGPGENPVVLAGETVEQCGVRESLEEVNLHVDSSELVLFHLGSSDLHDPRAHVVNGCFYVLIDDARRWSDLKAGDDIEGVKMLKIDEFIARPAVLAFNHTELALKGLAAWEKEVLHQKMVDNLDADDYMRLVYD